MVSGGNKEKSGVIFPHHTAVLRKYYENLFETEEHFLRHYKLMWTFEMIFFS